MTVVQVPKIRAHVTFLSAADGGRANAPHESPLYRPHVVVGDPSRRAAILASDGRTLTEAYLGVSFVGEGNPLQLGVEHAVTLQLIYHPDVDYTGLAPGATFTIREGPKVVGFGRVLDDSRAAI